MCVCMSGKGKETLRRRAGAMIKSFFILAFECLVFDAGFKKKSPSHTDIINEQRICPSSWKNRMTREGGGAVKQLVHKRDAT